ncbi:MAG TPA: hypothetical protein VFP70_00765 [Burkholderiales bacterium]|nr:hypothetical protein [Burkholderiales bacterium]
MPADKLILPLELQVCATCSFWDGERQVDDDARLVVVKHTCSGECLLRGQHTPCTLTSQRLNVCDWDPLPESAPPEDSTGENGSL